MTRWRSDAGAMAAEQVAIIAIVAAVIGALFAVGLPQKVGEEGRYAVCMLFNGEGECTPPADDPGSAAEDDPDGPPVCTTSSRQDESRTTTDLLFDRSVEGDRFVTMEHSDGSVTIIDTEYEGSGNVVGVGAEIPLSAKDTLGVTGEGSAVVIEGVGLVYELDAQAFEDYRDTVAQQAVDQYIHGPPELQALGAESPEEFLDTMAAADQLRRIWQQQVESYATHDVYSTTGEVSLDLGASWKLLNGSLGVGGSAGSTVQVDREGGGYSVTVDLNAEASQGVGAGVFGLGISSSQSGAAGGAITLSYDGDGELINASMTTSTEVGSDGFIGFDLGGLTGAPPGQDAGYGFDLAQGALVETTFDLPIATEADLDSLEDLLEDPVGSAQAAFEAAAADGSVLVQAYDVQETSANVGIAIRALASLGISGEDSTRQLGLEDAFSWDPTNGFMHRGDCLG